MVRVGEGVIVEVGVEVANKVAVDVGVEVTDGVDVLEGVAEEDGDGVGDEGAGVHDGEGVEVLVGVTVGEIPVTFIQIGFVRARN